MRKLKPSVSTKAADLDSPVCLVISKMSSSLPGNLRSRVYLSVTSVVLPREYIMGRRGPFRYHSESHSVSERSLFRAIHRAPEQCSSASYSKIIGEALVWSFSLLDNTLPTAQEPSS